MEEHQRTLLQTSFGREPGDNGATNELRFSHWPQLLWKRLLALTQQTEYVTNSKSYN